MTERRHLTLLTDAYIETVAPELDGLDDLEETFVDAGVLPPLSETGLRVLRHETPSN